VRYLFRGLIRDTGKPVEGHVEADSEEMAVNLLSENGYVTEAIRPDPRPADSILPPDVLQQLNRNAPPQPIADALDSALDTSATQVQFDALTERYKGKRVWVIDREKIRRRVAQVVDQALSVAQQEHTTAAETREAVAQAIEGLFKDNRNITSPAGQNANVQRLEHQITQLTGIVRQMQADMAHLVVAVKNMPRGGGGGPVRMVRSGAPSEERNEVLAEIFQHNVALRQRIAEDAIGPMPAAEAGGEPHAAAASASDRGSDGPAGGGGAGGNGAAGANGSGDGGGYPAS